MSDRSSWVVSIDGGAIVLHFSVHAARKAAIAIFGWSCFLLLSLCCLFHACNNQQWFSVIDIRRVSIWFPTLATQNTAIIPSSIKPPKGKEPTNPPRKSYAQMAASGSPKITTEKAWTEVTGSSRRRKATTPSTPKVEPEKEG